ncbi:MAG: hypothetical protein QOH81_2739 [Sphingomonadales bacterium]|nr:hypothetical protein [Sphingomonadales bacterium]
MAELAAAAPSLAALPRSFSYIGKIVAGAFLVTLADWLFFFADQAGATLGLFALAVAAALAIGLKPLRRSRPPLLAAAAALPFVFALVADPSLLALALLWLALSLAVLLPRVTGFDDAWRWTIRLAAHACRSLLAPLGDWRRLRAARRRRGGLRLAAHLPNLWLPLLGTILFLALFAAANPLIGDAFARLDLAGLIAAISFARIGFWLLVALLLWPLFRPRLARLAPAVAGDPDRLLPGFSLSSVTLSLFAFNAVFALQNGLDLAFLWSGAPLPDGMTLAEYAHRGAYPLIATALLAGLFVLATLRPGSAMAERPAIRRLVYFWIAQNVLLVASTILRTLDYVEAYSLTRLRIAALIWMALVAIGLVLICWRIWRGRSGAWLININAAAALLTLSACGFADLGSVAAGWNVRHAREAGGAGAQLDLCYLNRLDASSLLPLIALESGKLPPVLRERAAWTRNLIMDRLERRQADWHAWTWRGARRLAEARTEVAARRLPRFTAGRRLCDATFETPRPAPPLPAPPLPAPPLPASPLTATPQR